MFHPEASTQGSAVPAGPAASHPAWAGISELPLNLGFLFLFHRCVGLELVCSPAAGGVGHRGAVHPTELGYPSAE